MQSIIDYHKQRVCHLLGIPCDQVHIITDLCTHKSYGYIIKDCQSLGMIGAYWLCPMTDRHMIYVDTKSGRVSETVAHECRHVWQALTGALGEYDHSADYATNPHEVDATQWAMDYCNGLFD